MAVTAKSQAIAVLWKRGDLSYLLYDCQKTLYNNLHNAISNPDCSEYTVNCSRRFGKTTVLFIIACEYALKNPNSFIRFFAPYQNQIKRILREVSRVIDNAPQSLKPRYVNGVFEFSNGSVIYMQGLDNNQHDAARGSATHLAIIDEARDITDLQDVYESVLAPMTTTTRGTTIFSSTPPRTPAHFFGILADRCKAKDFYSKYTIHDNYQYPMAERERWVEQTGGWDSTASKREWLAEFVVDEKSVVIKEWDDKYIQEVKPDSLYKFYHKYVAMDMGVVNDFTAILFGYYDFRSGRLVIEDEDTFNGPRTTYTTQQIADSITTKENLLWQTKNPDKSKSLVQSQDYPTRIMDNNNPQMQVDLANTHNVHFIRTNKDELLTMVNEARMYVNAGKVIIHPRCKMLIGNLQKAVWKIKKSDINKLNEFDRTPEYGHFDHLAAFVYLIRNLDIYTNPVPADFNFDINSQVNFDNTIKADPPIPPKIDPAVDSWSEDQTTQELQDAFGLNQWF